MYKKHTLVFSFYTHFETRCGYRQPMIIARTLNDANPSIGLSNSKTHTTMASSSQRRITTVHDRAALRVHPDGTRVTARESRYATEDLQRNRVAVNAGGVGNVKKRKRAAFSDDGTEPLEEFDIETDEYQPSESQPNSTDSYAGEVEDESEGAGRKRKRQRKDARTIKRAQFYQNFDFILGGKHGVENTATSNDLLLPSSVSRAVSPDLMLN